MKRSGSKVRSLCFNPPKGDSNISGAMPLIKEMFHRQSRKRTRVVQPMMIMRHIFMLLTTDSCNSMFYMSFW